MTSVLAAKLINVENNKKGFMAAGHEPFWQTRQWHQIKERNPLNEKYTSPIIPIRSPWRKVLLDALQNIQHSLLIVSPYIKENAVVVMQEALLSQVNRQTALEIRIITRVEADELLSGSSDISALQRLLLWSTTIRGCTVAMRAIPNVHAKVWICDTHLAIVGSGNATAPGLDENIEYGLSVTDPHLIEQILQDWQPYWEQASPVDNQLLDQMQLWLQDMQQSADVQKITAQQKILKRKLRTAPRIGQRILPGERSQDTKFVIKEPPIPASDIQPVPAQTITGAVETFDSNILTKPEILQKAFSLSAHDFWQALCWVLPFEEDAYGLINDDKHRDAFLKLSWKPATEQSVLQFIWADGKRYSQATLSIADSSHLQPWSVTLNVEQIHMLGNELQRLQKKGYFAAETQRQLWFHLNTKPYELCISYIRKPERSDRTNTIVLPCTPSSMPGNFPTQRAPVSQITIDHIALKETLAVLSQQPSNIVELWLDTSGTQSHLTLSTGQIEDPITLSLPGQHCILNGPSVKLRLDLPSLEHIVNSTDKIQNWQLRIDRYAETVQFSSQLDMSQAIFSAWKHELQHL